MNESTPPNLVIMWFLLQNFCLFDWRFIFLQKKIRAPQISQKFVFYILLNDIKSSLSKLNTIDPSFFYIIPVQAGEVKN